MACCLTVSKNYLHQYRFIIYNVIWHSVHVNLYLKNWYIGPQVSLKFTHLKSQPHLPGANELTYGGLVLHVCISKRDHHWSDALHWHQAITLTYLGRDKMAPFCRPLFFKCILLNENIWISAEIWLKFIPKGEIDTVSTSVQIMAWCQTGDKPFSEPMVA